MFSGPAQMGEPVNSVADDPWIHQDHARNDEPLLLWHGADFRTWHKPRLRVSDGSLGNGLGFNCGTGRG